MDLITKLRKLALCIAFSFSLSSAAEVLCLDYLGMCHALVFANTTYPRPGIQVGLAVSINAYDESHMRTVLQRVLADFAANGLSAYYRTSSKTGNLPTTFPGQPDLHIHDFRREYDCEGFDGCEINGRIMEAFSMGYRLDTLNASDVEAIQEYVHNETGGRLDRTLNEMCTQFDKTCMTTAISTLPAPTTAPSQPTFTSTYLIAAVISGTVLVAGATAAYFLIRRFCPPRELLAESDDELVPLRN